VAAAAFNYGAIIVTGPQWVTDGRGDIEKALSANDGGPTADTIFAVRIFVGMD